MRIAVLAGGVGAARFLSGLARVAERESVTVVVNTADDLELYGLHVSPDLDTVSYTLAGTADPSRGWGLEGDTFEAVKRLARFAGEDPWFQLGDLDLATHIHRTQLLREGWTLSEATERIRRTLGVAERILPMSDDPVRTFVQTPAGELDFQTYFVRRKAADPVSGVRFAGAAESRPAPGVLHTIRAADRVIIAPSNPIISIGPVLAVPGIADALRSRGGPTLAVSPLVAGRALKGPTAEMLQGLGKEPSCVGVAREYRDVVDRFVLDEQDSDRASEVAAIGLTPIVAPTIMKGPPEREELARRCLEAMT